MAELPNELPQGLPRFYPLSQMAMFIAMRVQPRGEPLRTTIDKVRKRLVYATEKGDLQTVGTDRYHVPQTIAWAQGKWFGKFDDLYAERSANATAGIEMRDEVEAWVIPGDLPSCRQALDDTHRENQQLRTELKMARAEIDRLTPIAQKYERNCEGNTRSANGERNRRL